MITSDNPSSPAATITLHRTSYISKVIPVSFAEDPAAASAHKCQPLCPIDPVLPAWPKEASGYENYYPPINGSDTDFSQPYVLTYPQSGYPTDEPRPVLQVDNLTGYTESNPPSIDSQVERFLAEMAESGYATKA